MTANSRPTSAQLVQQGNRISDGPCENALFVESALKCLTCGSQTADEQLDASVAAAATLSRAALFAAARQTETLNGEGHLCHQRSEPTTVDAYTGVSHHVDADGNSDHDKFRSRDRPRRDFTSPLKRCTLEVVRQLRESSRTETRDDKAD